MSRSKERGWIVGIAVAGSLIGSASWLFPIALEAHQWLAWGPVLIGWWVGYHAYLHRNPFPALGTSAASPLLWLRAVSFDAWMKTVRLAWGALVNLIEFVVILAVLSRGSQRRDSIVIVGLVLIYLGVATGFQLLGRTLAEASIRSVAQFAALSKLLGDQHHNEYAEALEDHDKKLKSTVARFFMDILFRSAEWLISLWYLFSSL